MLLAAAGSAKIATTVAKNGYALTNRYFESERILLLAFNSAAAAELSTRLKERLSAFGLPAEKVAA